MKTNRRLKWCVWWFEHPYAGGAKQHWCNFYTRAEAEQYIATQSPGIFHLGLISKLSWNPLSVRNSQSV